MMSNITKKDQIFLIVDELIRLKRFVFRPGSWFRSSDFGNLRSRRVIKTKYPRHYTSYIRIYLAFNPETKSARLESFSKGIESFDVITDDELVELCYSKIFEVLKSSLGYKANAKLALRLRTIKDEMKQELLQNKLDELGITR